MSASRGTNPGTRQPRAYTLLEVVAVIVVLAVISAVVASSALRRPSSLAAETALLRSNLRFAQTRAMADNGAEWSVEITGAGYSLHRDGALASTSWPGGTSSTHAFPGLAVQITAGTGTIVYDAWGSPGPADHTITLADADQTSDLTLVGVTGFIP